MSSLRGAQRRGNLQLYKKLPRFARNDGDCRYDYASRNVGDCRNDEDCLKYRVRSL